MAGVYGTPVVSVHKAAAVFVPLTDGANTDEVAAFLTSVGSIGAGLHELLQTEQNVGGIFRVIFNLTMLTEMVIANQHNCQRLCLLGHDVLGVLDNAGRRGASVRAIGLEALTACFEDICTMVDAFTQPGWLLRMACDTRLREEFETLHQAVVELVKGEGLLSLAGARPLVTVDYKDFARPLRRMLKQMGSGSLAAGVQQLRVNDKYRIEVGRLLGVHPALVKEEIAQLPESDMELNMLYHQLLSTSSNNGTPSRVSDTQSSRPDSRSGSRRASHAEHGDTPPLGRPSSSSSFSLSMSGPAAMSLYGDLFRWYDRNKSGALEADELQAALRDLGMLDGKKPEEIPDAMLSYMRMADAAAASRGDGIGFDAFCKFYETLVMAKARQQLRFKLGLQVEEDLRTTFMCFAGFGSREVVTEMDGAHFQKLCRDCGLVDKNTGITEIDLVFCYVKTKGARRITFEQFLTALSKLAERKGIAFEDVVMRVLTAGGPVANASIQPEYVRLHDDKSTFTGVYARGGPSPQDWSEGLELALIVNRSIPETAKRGAGSPSSPGSGVHPNRRVNMRSFGGVLGGGSTTHSTPPSNSAQITRANSMGSTTPFASFAGAMRSPRGEAIAQNRFAAARSPSETGVSGGAFSLFNRRRSGSAAAAGGASAAAAAAAPNAANAPALPGVLVSRANSASCSPSIIDGQGGQMVPSSGGDNSNEADIVPGSAQRSSSPAMAQSLGSKWWASTIGGSRRASRDAGTGAGAPPGAEGASASKPQSKTLPKTPPTGGSGEVQLRDVFAAFAGFGIRSPGVYGGSFRISAGGMCRVSAGGMGASSKQQQEDGSPAVFKPLMLEMDGFRFVKLCREAGLFDDNFTSTGADIIFTKVKTKGAKKISYAQFMTALSLIASIKKVPPQSLVDAVLRCGGPAVNSSLNCMPCADLVRVHDN